MSTETDDGGPAFPGYEVNEDGARPALPLTKSARNSGAMKISACCHSVAWEAQNEESYEMKERPILFSAPMVRAILDWRKTQTRRVVKPQPPDDIGLPIGVDLYSPTCIGKNGDEYPGDEIFGAYSECGEWGVKCPYGQPGDRLWVRETWGPCDGGVCYRADEDAGSVALPDDGRWTPSIHMPRWASRITLEITGVRVERLQDISEADAIAEGVPAVSSGGVTLFTTTGVNCFQAAKGAYAALWESINGPGSWDANPWVWVVEFRRIDK